MISFRFNATKALQAVEWMLHRANNRADLHTILKACYFADRQMLNEHGRPIFGATYRALNYGPVPVEIWDMLKGDILTLYETGRDRTPWEFSGHFVTLPPGRNSVVIPDSLAPIELLFLDEALEQCRNMTFNERTAATHGSDWVKGTYRPGKLMDYADMIDRPDREELIAYLETMGPRIAL